ncbi:MAG TPA: hypothetical protein DHW14_02630 [Clostridiales bacterium]|nr:hypothetical protein [Clostridiales bacterium]
MTAESPRPAHINQCPDPPGGGVSLTAWPDWLVWFLALYGLCLLAVGAWEFLRETAARRKSPAPAVSLLVVVRNEEALVEGAVRRFIARHGPPGRRRPVYELVLVDDRSTDDTPLILRKLEREYPGFVRVATVERGAGEEVSPVRVGVGLCRGEVLVGVDLQDLDSPGLLADSFRDRGQGPSASFLRRRGRGSVRGRADRIPALRRERICRFQ